MLSPRNNSFSIPIETGDSAITSLTDKRLRALAASYAEWASGKPMAARSDIVPRKIPRLLPYILLFDRITQHGRASFRTRLCGSEITDMLRFDATGESFGANPPAGDITSRIAQTLNTVIAVRGPVRVAGNLQLTGREFVRFEAIFFPLSDDGIVIDKILGCVVRRPATQGKMP